MRTHLLTEQRVNARSLRRSTQAHQTTRTHRVSRQCQRSPCCVTAPSLAQYAVCSYLSFRVVAEKDRILYLVMIVNSGSIPLLAPIRANSSGSGMLGATGPAGTTPTAASASRD